MDINYLLIELIGYFGAALLISGYFLVSSGRWNPKGFKFNGLNLTAAIVYAIYAVIREVPPVLIVQVFWGGVAIIALWKLFKK